MTTQTLFDLENRVPLARPFSDVAVVRAFDLSMRKSALVAYSKPAKRILSYCAGEEARTLVEVGVNTGLLSIYVGGKRPHVVVSGLEENQNLLEVAEENLSLAVWAETPGDIEFELGKLHRLPYADASANVVYSFNSLHLWKRPVETLKECARICKPDGVVLIADINRHAEEGHITFVLQFVKEGAQEFMDSLRSAYNPAEIRALLREAGLPHWRVFEDDLGLWIASRPQDDLTEVASEA